MKKLQSSFKNMVLVLTGVTVIATGLLAYVNALTKAPIEQANAKALNDALKLVVPAFDNNPVAESDTIFSEKGGKQVVDYIIYKATKDGEFVGAAVQSSANGFGGALVVLVGFDKEGQIIDYSLLAHTETPGLGSKAADWFKKDGKGSIIGMNPEKTPLAVNKDGGSVDAITASTITSRAFLKAINNAYQAYASSLQSNDNSDGESGASKQMGDATQDAAVNKTDSINQHK
ncbi:MAG: RnfABCDGE type electron transport complex subunit G [Bacteroides sp.]